jgi:hypothetical protein
MLVVILQFKLHLYFSYETETSLAFLLLIFRLIILELDVLL